MVVPVVLPVVSNKFGFIMSLVVNKEKALHNHISTVILISRVTLYLSFGYAFVSKIHQTCGIIAVFHWLGSLIYLSH